VSGIKCPTDNVNEQYFECHVVYGSKVHADKCKYLDQTVFYFLEITVKCLLK
jgi:hypothetical protein